MNTWRAPAVLWLLGGLPVVAVFFAWAVRQRRRALQRFAETRLLPSLTPDLDFKRQWIRSGLILMTITLVLLGLAGPRWGFRWEEVKREGVDIIVAIDTSRSMLAEDVKPNRLDRAKLAILDLVKQLRGDRIGLVPFAGSAFVQCPLTLDYEAFAESLRAVTVGIIPKGGTALAEALRSSIAALEGHQGKHEVIIVITDGEDHDGKYEAAAQQANEHGIKVYTVGIGTPDGELIPLTDRGQQGFLKDRRGQVVKSRLDEAALQKIAVTTGAAYVHATGPALGLDTVYNDYIRKMEPRELKSTLEQRAEERFQIPIGLALLALMLESLVGNRKPSTRGMMRPRRWWRHKT